MSTYHIHSRNRVYTVTTSASEVTDAPPELDWAFGLPFAHVRTWCERRGWLIVPVTMDTERFNYIHKGITYRFHIRHGRVEVLTQDGESIDMAKLPDELKGLL
jgi:hypothetical protein